MQGLTAKIFIEQLFLLKSKAALKSVQRFFREENTKSQFLGIKMARIFEQAKMFAAMPLYLKLKVE